MAGQGIHRWKQGLGQGRGQEVGPGAGAVRGRVREREMLNGLAATSYKDYH